MTIDGEGEAFFMRNQLVPQSNTLDLMPETKRPKSVIADLDHQSVSDNDEDD